MFFKAWTILFHIPLSNNANLIVSHIKNTEKLFFNITFDIYSLIYCIRCMTSKSAMIFFGHFVYTFTQTSFWGFFYPKVFFNNRPFSKTGGSFTRTSLTKTPEGRRSGFRSIKARSKFHFTPAHKSVLQDGRVDKDCSGSGTPYNIYHDDSFYVLGLTWFYRQRRPYYYSKVLKL